MYRDGVWLYFHFVGDRDNICQIVIKGQKFEASGLGSLEEVVAKRLPDDRAQLSVHSHKLRLGSRFFALTGLANELDDINRGTDIVSIDVDCR